MSVTIQVDSSRLESQLEALDHAFVSTGRISDANTIVEDEARLFLKTCIGLTPPKNQAQGKAAVSRDLNKLFTPVSGAFAGHVSAHFGNAHVQQFLTNKSGEVYEIDWDRLDLHGYGMARFHQGSRISRGRVGRRNLAPGKKGGKWKAAYVVTYETLLNYKKEVFKRVGRMKSGWLPAFLAAGGKAPAWISRHAATAPGSVRNELAVKGCPRIAITNYAPGIGLMQPVVHNALRIRVEAIKRRVRLVMSGYNRDLANKMKITRKARRTTTPDF